jgi:hypothetical protein
MRADHDAAAHAGAGDPAKGIRHERSGLAHGNHAQRRTIQQRTDVGLPDSAVNQMIRGRCFNRAAGDREDVLAKEGQT